MVQPIPPPRTYRAKTRLARCRARQLAIRQSAGASAAKDSDADSDSNTNAKGGSNRQADLNDSCSSPWVQFDSGTDISTSWSGDSADRPAVEVEIDRTPRIHDRRTNWESEPVDDNMRNMPVIPVPTPSRIIPRDNPPLQPRDTNTIPRIGRGSSSSVSVDDSSQYESKKVVRKMVSRPISSSRGRT